jgi:hypothetical protein
MKYRVNNDGTIQYEDLVISPYMCASTLNKQSIIIESQDARIAELEGENKELDAGVRDEIRKIVREELAAAAQRPMKDEPTPEPVKDLRWLVERHECLRAELEWDPANESDRFRFHLLTTQAYFSDNGAMTWIVGIVHGKINQTTYSCISHWDVRPWGGGWGVWFGVSRVLRDGPSRILPTQIEAIDALLTAMEEST